MSGNTLIIGDTTITATPEDGYKFVEWQNVPETATENMNIQAVFEEESVYYTVTFRVLSPAVEVIKTYTVEEGTVLAWISDYTYSIGDETFTFEGPFNAPEPVVMITMGSLSYDEYGSLVVSDDVLVSVRDF